MTASEYIVLTGASGAIGAALRARLARPGRVLGLVDLVDPAARDCERAFVGSVTDRALLDAAFAGADAVVHLGGHPKERAWSQIADANIDGTQSVLERAAAAGVRRVMLASSIHAAGYATLGELRTADPGVVRPDTYYGVGKVAAEALGAVFADRYELSVVSARIASFAEQPANPRAIGLWLSPDDAARLTEAACAHHEPGHRVMWGVSANTRGPLPLEAGYAIGFAPRDDAERWALSFDAEAIDRALADDRFAADAFIDDAHPLGGQSSHVTGRARPAT